ncbi:MAG TPA: hypothetical protein VNX66_17635 [Candidatus Sulfotelmatobacter sp.]|jgi:hypothetical protein|nr:hypothetical protein [Candidatus Sulfotelmatobacter sp.]
MKITHTTYCIEVWCKKSTRAAARRHGKQFNRRVERAIGEAILQAARLKIREYIRSSKLDKDFGVELES